MMHIRAVGNLITLIKVN